jgi:hypothetical protein
MEVTLLGTIKAPIIPLGHWIKVAMALSKSAPSTLA